MTIGSLGSFSKHDLIALMKKYTVEYISIPLTILGRVDLYQSEGYDHHPGIQDMEDSLRRSK